MTRAGHEQREAVRMTKARAITGRAMRSIANKLFRIKISSFIIDEFLLDKTFDIKYIFGVRF
ncbi:MAG: hypothetical protein II882_01420 [Lachnospiraceae bacterium]|nr:hypothetical protein [Lachnospiraceae bacterium]